HLLERWRKWRRRRPLVLPLGLLVAVLVAVMVGLGFLVWASVEGWVGKDLAEARESLHDGERLLEEGRFASAVNRLKVGHDLAAVRTTLRVHLAGGREKEQARREALAVLAEAEESLGPSPVLEQERRTHTAALGPEQNLARVQARTAWEHYALGRSFLLAGK